MSVQIILSLHIAEGPVVVGGGPECRPSYNTTPLLMKIGANCRPKRSALCSAGKSSKEKYRLQPFLKRKEKKIASKHFE